MKCHSKTCGAGLTENTLMEVFLWTEMSRLPGECAVRDGSPPSVSRGLAVSIYVSLTFNLRVNHLIYTKMQCEDFILSTLHRSVQRGGDVNGERVNLGLCVTSMKDLMENRLASIVDRPWARQLWAMKPAFSSARQIASSPSFQFQLGMFSRWAFITR